MLILAAERFVVATPGGARRCTRRQGGAADGRRCRKEPGGARLPAPGGRQTSWSVRSERQDRESVVHLGQAAQGERPPEVPRQDRSRGDRRGGQGGGAARRAERAGDCQTGGGGSRSRQESGPAGWPCGGGAGVSRCLRRHRGG